jgi:peptide/nickel transport system substrate-binding protein
MSMHIGYNMTKPMFKDKETRQALTMLIDRKGIINDLLLGFGTEMAGPYSVNRKANDPSIKPLPFDPEAAKKKLADAGWKPGSDGVLERDGVKFEFALSLRTGVPIRERIATRVQQWLKQAGIKMAITPYEPSVLFQRMDDRNFDAVLAGWGAGGIEDDPYQIWDSKSIENKGSNYVGFNNPEADKAIEAGRRTLDEKKRQEYWHKFQRICYDEQPYTWLYCEQDCAFIDGRFKNTKPYPIGLNETDWYVPLAAQKYR